MDKRSLRQRVYNLLRAKRHKVRDNMEVATISGNEVGDEPMEETETTFGSNAVGRSESTRSTRSLERTDYLNRTTAKVKRSYNSLPGNFVLRGTFAFKSRNKTVENRQKSSGKTYHLCFCCCAQVEDEPYSELEETKFEMLARPYIDTDSKGGTGSYPGLSETTLAERTPGSDDRMRQEAIENMTRPPLGNHPSPLDGARVIDGAWGGASAILGCGVGPIVVVTEAASVYSVNIPLIVTSAEVEICTDELHDESQGDLCSVVVDKDYLFPNRTMDQVESDSLGKLEVPTLSRRSSRRQSMSSNFELTRFRKRKLNNENDDIRNDNNSDTISIQSFDISGNEKKKSKRSLLRVSTSLVNLISPGRHHQKQQQDPDGFKVPCSPSRQPTSPYKPPQPSPAKRRQQVSWVDSFAGGQNANTLSAFSHIDIKRQEAIYELYQGEKDMLEDLANVAKLYRDTLVTLGLMTASDVCTLFGNIDNLIPVHRDLLDRLEAQRKPDGTSMSVGKEILEWTNKLSAYVTFCANQIKAKEIFDEKKNEPALNDFYQRCQASPFSRKLDLWSLLDGARGRFVKYPLLIRSIAKYTVNDREEAENLEQSIKEMETIIQEADEATGLARCEHAKSLLIYLYDDQRVSAIQESQAFVCSGCMKNTKGSKLHVFLFDKVLLVSRSCTQSGKQMYQIYRQPIPTAELLVQDLPDGEVKLGSFRNAFGQGGLTGKNVIRLSFMDTEKGQTHTLIANDEHDKRQWMQAFHKVTSNIVVVPESKNKDKPSS